MSVRYKSTRGVQGGSLSFEEVVLGGLASDKGLFVPESIPTFSLEEINKVGVSLWLLQHKKFKHKIIRITDARPVILSSGFRGHFQVCRSGPDTLRPPASLGLRQLQHLSNGRYDSDVSVHKVLMLELIPLSFVSFRGHTGGETEGLLGTGTFPWTNFRF